MEWLITNSLAAFLVPPGCVLVLLAAGLLLTWRRPPVARGLVFLSLLALYALATPFIAGALIRLLEPDRLDPTADKGGQAIVVLGAGIYFNAPEYGGDTVSNFALARLRYGAHLHRALKKPILVSGGAPQGNPRPEAELMKQVLQRDFLVPVQWVESASRTTLENARASFHVLNAAGASRIYLVTHAWHMPRARLAFEAAGFSVIPAGTGYSTGYEMTLLDFLPSASALQTSSWFCHEVIGLGWYHLRLAFGR